MTNNGVADLYDRMVSFWPMVYKPNASENFKQTSMKNFREAYQKYSDTEVLTALMTWALDNEKPPTVKNIINEVEWAKVKRSTAGRENEQLWPMDCIDKEGREFTYGSFKRADFLQHPMNTEGLQPEEWERRFKATRNRWYQEHRPEPSPEAKAWAAKITAAIRAHIEGRSNNEDIH